MPTKKEKIVITAALPYANGDIHIGHLLEYIQADIYARFLRLMGKDVLYICASDMHGTPVEVNAKKAGKKPQEFANEFWKEHQKDFAAFQIKFDNYYKTHSAENKELSELFFATLRKKGFIQIKSMNTIYCEQDQRYLPDRYVKGTCPNCGAEGQYGDICESCSSVLKAVDLINPKCSLCGRTPIEKESEHYFFSLGKFTAQLKKWLSSADIQPEINHLLQEWLTKGLEDWCISRDEPYFGFEIPDSKKETGEKKYFYVWLDAPIGYISSTENYCQKKLLGKLSWEDYWKKGNVHHFIGKDIVYFHYLFWPAMLMAMDIPLPKITTHGFITVNGQKMSKSRGTFFTAKDFLKLYPAEALRFFYASHLDRKVIDVDVDVQNFKAVNNNVLMGSLGNYCYRVLTFAEKNYGSVLDVASEKEMTAEIIKLQQAVQDAYQNLNFKEAVKKILQIADIGNSYFQNSEVWKDKDSVKSRAKVGWCVNVARILAVLCSPILPEFSSKIAKAFGEKELSLESLTKPWKGKLKPIEHLVKKIEDVPERDDSRPNSLPLRNLEYSISPEVEKLGVKVRLTQFSGLRIKKKHEGIERLKKEVQINLVNYEDKKVLERYSLIDKETGVDSHHHPNSVIHLLKLIKEKGKLPQINTVVDIYNLVSVKWLISMATHDLHKLDGPIEIRLSADGEQFFSLDGKTEKLNGGEVIYSNKGKVIGRFSKQCKQTITTDDSTELVLVAFGNSEVSDEKMDKAVKEACELIIKFNGGSYRLIGLDFPKFPLQLRVGKIIEVKDHPQADSLYLLKVDLGPELGKKQVVAGLKKHLDKGQLLDRKAVFCTNIKPAKIRGEVSEVMVLAPDDSIQVTLIDAEKSKLGAEATFQGLSAGRSPITFEQFTQLVMTAKDGKVWFEGKKLSTAVEDLVAAGVKDGARVK